MNRLNFVKWKSICCIQKIKNSVTNNSRKIQRKSDV